MRTGQTRRVGALLAGLACSAVLVAGCGDVRTAAPNVSTPATPTGYISSGFPRVGITFVYPKNWVLTPMPLPLDATVTSGLGVIALWRFPLAGPAPSGKVALRAARQRLVEAARARDRSLVVIRSKVTRIGGLPAIVLDTIQRIRGATRRVRSLHIFAPEREIVIEEYAPPAEFHAVDHYVFSPLNHSIAVRRSPTRTA